MAAPPSAVSLQDTILPFHKTVGQADKESDETLSLQEREIMSRIHDLQRRLAKHTEEESKRTAPMTLRTRLIVVSNRLPVTVRRDEDTGEWEFAVSSGGLVSALARTRSELPFVWVGWLGEEVPEPEQPQIRKRLRDKYNCVPVFLPAALAEKYYNGFSNDIVWPLFHYFPLPVGKHAKHFDHGLWDAYKAANKAFSETVVELHQKGDLIWVQDYHLMVLPAFLRARLHKARIGWFLHTPFPSADVFRMLPVREEILRSLLAADMVGFHTYDYARHFLSACSRILRATIRPSGVESQGRFTASVVAPIGIDPDYFQGIAQRPETQQRLAELRAEFKGKRVLLGVDRLDYIKGLPHKMLAMEGLLQHYDRWRGSVVFIQIGVPTRSKVHLYQKLSRTVNELVGRVNGLYGSLDYAPIRYINRSVTPQELVALYMVADACVVSSIRDGMNLVSHEYVACQGQKESPGVLILSEFAGSAQCLSGAIRVNPWNTNDLAAAMDTALQLSVKDRQLRHRQLYHYVSQTNTASMWAKSFVSSLRTVSGSALRPGYLRPPNFAAYYRRSSRRLIVLSCDGLIARTAPIAQAATPDKRMRTIVRHLASDPRNVLVIVSCRERRVLEQWFGGVRAVLVAEHGVLVRVPAAATSATSSFDEWRSDSVASGAGTGDARASAVSDSSASHDPFTGAGVGAGAGSGSRAGSETPDGRRSTGSAARLAGAASPLSLAFLTERRSGLERASSTGALDAADAPPGAVQRGQSVPSSWYAVAQEGSGGAPPPPELVEASDDGDGGEAADAPAQRMQRLHRKPTTMPAPDADGGGVWGLPMNVHADRDNWQNIVRSIFWHFTEITPGSVVEVRDNSVAWYHGEADPELASWQAKEMQATTLATAIGELPLDVVNHRRVVEVRVAGASVVKAIKMALRALALDDPVDSVFCIGNSREVFDPVFDFLVPRDAARMAETNDELAAKLGVKLGSRHASRKLVRDVDDAIPGVADGAKIFTSFVGREATKAQFNLELTAAKTLMLTFASMSADAVAGNTAAAVHDASITHRQSVHAGSSSHGSHAAGALFRVDHGSHHHHGRHRHHSHAGSSAHGKGNGGSSRPHHSRGRNRHRDGGAPRMELPQRLQKTLSDPTTGSGGGVVSASVGLVAANALQVPAAAVEAVPSRSESVGDDAALPAQ